MKEDFQRLGTTKFNIRQALKSVGVDVPISKRFDEYPPYITGLESKLPLIVEVSVTTNVDDIVFYGTIVEEHDYLIGRYDVPSDGEAHTMRVAMAPVLGAACYLCTSKSLADYTVTTTGDVSHPIVTAPEELNIFTVGGEGTITIEGAPAPAPTESLQDA